MQLARGRAGFELLAVRLQNLAPDCTADASQRMDAWGRSHRQTFFCFFLLSWRQRVSKLKTEDMGLSPSL